MIDFDEFSLIMVNIAKDTGVYINSWKHNNAELKKFFHLKNLRLVFSKVIQD